MRVTGGALSGRRLSAPVTRAIRPMRDAVRLALFNILAPRVPDSRFLDLFAGTGGVGVEALSRGAAHATFVEQLPAALKLIHQNLHRLELEGRSRVLAQDVFLALAQLRWEPFDLVFVGPPYNKGLAQRALAALAQTPPLSDGGLVAVEVFHKEVLEQRYGRLVRLDRRRYGDNRLELFQLAAR